jgi:hypothetical protein
VNDVSGANADDGNVVLSPRDANGAGKKRGVSAGTAPAASTTPISSFWADDVVRRHFVGFVFLFFF